MTRGQTIVRQNPVHSATPGTPSLPSSAASPGAPLHTKSQFSAKAVALPCTQTESRDKLPQLLAVEKVSENRCPLCGHERANRPEPLRRGWILDDPPQLIHILGGLSHELCLGTLRERRLDFPKPARDPWRDSFPREDFAYISTAAFKVGRPWALNHVSHLLDAGLEMSENSLVTRVLLSDLQRDRPEAGLRGRERFGDELGLLLALPGEGGENVAVLDLIKRFAKVPRDLEACGVVARRYPEDETKGAFTVQLTKGTPEVTLSIAVGGPPTLAVSRCCQKRLEKTEASIGVPGRERGGKLVEVIGVAWRDLRRALEAAPGELRERTFALAAEMSPHAEEIDCGHGMT